MPKSITITKEMIDGAAFHMVKREGLQVLTARNIASELKCSTQPIYKTYENMDVLKETVMKMLMEFMLQQILGYKKTSCAFLDSGLGYIHVARTEKILFHLFCLENEAHNILKSDIGNEQVRALMEQELDGNPLSQEARDRVFLQTMIFTYGLAVLCYLGHLELDEDGVAALLEKTYNSYVNQELEEEK